MCFNIDGLLRSNTTRLGRIRDQEEEEFRPILVLQYRRTASVTSRSTGMLKCVYWSHLHVLDAFQTLARRTGLRRTRRILELPGNGTNGVTSDSAAVSLARLKCHAAGQRFFCVCTAVIRPCRCQLLLYNECFMFMSLKKLVIVQETARYTKNTSKLMKSIHCMSSKGEFC